ncbi:uncharacterized protein FIBRA_02057 [Fibroporia radiculosa]|uniref:Uncharacterized protein n=1 Tax=Fibroporia radiculosa TaxID=599839 RepID=J4I8U7_9APHY|nr:uncharacterized protein FIBRA_02057 [Fibroporia radiculosa]CCM00031.1 predicted protein [Fibroporia radiculosa]
MGSSTPLGPPSATSSGQPVSSALSSQLPTSSYSSSSGLLINTTSSILQPSASVSMSTVIPVNMSYSNGDSNPSAPSSASLSPNTLSRESQMITGSVSPSESVETLVSILAASSFAASTQTTLVVQYTTEASNAISFSSSLSSSETILRSSIASTLSYSSEENSSSTSVPTVAGNVNSSHSRPNYVTAIIGGVIGGCLFPVAIIILLRMRRNKLKHDALRVGENLLLGRWLNDEFTVAPRQSIPSFPSRSTDAHSNRGMAVLERGQPENLECMKAPVPARDSQLHHQSRHLSLPSSLTRTGILFSPRPNSDRAPSYRSHDVDEGADERTLGWSTIHRLLPVFTTGGLGPEAEFVLVGHDGHSSGSLVLLPPGYRD